MTTTLQQLIADRDALDRQIKELQTEARLAAIAKIRAIVADHGLEQKDIFTSRSSSKSGKTSGVKVPAKYRDAETGNEWSGRGIPPVWMRGKDKKDYLIA
jgi:DNA-binding protein H-NS